MIRRAHIILLTLLSMLAVTSHAQWAELSSGDLDTRTLRIQTKAEELYVGGDFERAHFIYVNELAGMGDKYAQYMAGYMYFMGQGVAEDPVQASAWYRIAAERRAPEFIDVRDELMQSLSPEQREQSDAIYVGLREKYSDLVIVMKLVEVDLDALQFESTGSRVPGRSTMVTMVDPRSGRSMSSDHYRKRAMRLIQSRVDFITGQLDIDDLDADLTGAERNDLWERIEEHVAVVDDETGAYVANP